MALIMYRMCDWSQTSLILSLALSLIIGEEFVLYVILVLVDCAP